MSANTLIRALSPSLTLARRLLWRPATPSSAPAEPLRSEVPSLRFAEIAAIYSGNRTAGDFYEFLRVSPNRVLFGLFDLAGRRPGTGAILVAAQDTFRTLAPRLFSSGERNEADAMIELSHQINRTILRVAGVRSCPAFLGCYNEYLGTICYANAGHTPALLRSSTGITELPAMDLPLGLFSHTTRNAATCPLGPGAVLLAVSRGVVEAERSDGTDFGLDGAKQAFLQCPAATVHEICLATLLSVQLFTQGPPRNDATALALRRSHITTGLS